jgi:hypothetical protein
MTYSEKLKDPRWQKERLKIMERDGFRCWDCKSHTKTLHVHHSFYESANPWETHSDFLLTLCEDCHKKRHRVQDRLNRAIARTISQLPLKEVIALTDDIESAATSPGSIRVVDLDDYQWNTDIRWFSALDDAGRVDLYMENMKKWGELPK